MARHAPDWPRLMRRETAAMYCDMTPVEFEREVSDARMPLPIKIGGREHWSRTAIDEQINRLTGDAIPDWRAASKLYAQR